MLVDFEEYNYARIKAVVCLCLYSLLSSMTNTTCFHISTCET
jgi:hypothetical protein